MVNIALLKSVKILSIYNSKGNFAICCRKVCWMNLLSTETHHPAICQSNMHNETRDATHIYEGWDKAWHGYLHTGAGHRACGRELCHVCHQQVVPLTPGQRTRNWRSHRTHPTSGYSEIQHTSNIWVFQDSIWVSGACNSLKMTLIWYSRSTYQYNFRTFYLTLK